MTRVVALVAWSNGNVTMEEKGVYEIDDALATDLIAEGLCADAATYFGGGGDGLPAPTANDIGKVATAIAIKGNSIASKNNATLTGTSETSIPTVMEFVNIFVNGATIIASIDGTDAVGTVVEVNPLSNKLEVEIGGYTYKFQRNGENLKLSKTGSDTKTVNVALYTATVGEGWENPKTSGGVLVVTDTDGTLDKTYAEIVAAGYSVIENERNGFMFIYPFRGYGYDAEHNMYAVFYGEGDEYTCATEDDYPSNQNQH